MYSKILNRTLLFALTLLMTASAHAQQTKRLTLDEAVSMGMTTSHQLAISQSKADVAKAKYKEQFGASIPQIALNSQYQHLSTNIEEIKFQNGVDPVTKKPTYGIIGVSIHDQLLNSLSISQILFAGFRGVNLIRAASDNKKAAGYDLEADKANIKNNIITAYYNHYKLTESKKVVEENIKLMQQRLKDAQNLRSVGMALKNDELQLSLSVSNLQQSAADVQSAIDISNYNLDLMLGLPENTQIEIAEAGLFTAKPSFNEGEGLKNALLVRPEVKAADIRFRTSKKQLAIARGMYAPIISAGFNAYYSKPNQRVFIEDQIRFHDSWDIGVKLSWNITNLFTTNFATDEAKSNIKAATAAQQITSDNIKMEVNANYSAYKLALDKIQLNQTAIEQALENQKLTKDQYTNGVKNTTDMLNADNLAITTQINLISAKIDAEIAYAKLMKATGN